MLLHEAIYLYLRWGYPLEERLGGCVVAARNKGHWGTGDLEISLRIMGEFEDVKPLLGRAYLGN